jgi:ParB-like chromosome segregation protein Spo0J
MSNIIAVPLNKLTRSARNVRKSGGESIDDLSSSILVHGLIHNLTVVEQLADNGENSAGMRSKIASMKSKPEKWSSLANKRARPE